MSMVFEKLHLAVLQAPQVLLRAPAPHGWLFGELLLCCSVADQHRCCRERLRRILCPKQPLIFSTRLIEFVGVAELGI